MLNLPNQTDVLQQVEAAYSLLRTDYEASLRKIQSLDAKVFSLEEEITRLTAYYISLAIRENEVLNRVVVSLIQANYLGISFIMICQKNIKNVEFATIC